jgi:hypothetical protein
MDVPLFKTLVNKKGGLDMLQATRDAITQFLGDRTDDEAIALLETIDNEGVDEENWKQKYEDNDAEWRKKYTERFKEGKAVVPPTPEPKTDEPIDEDERVESLNLNELLYGSEGK